MQVQQRLAIPRRTFLRRRSQRLRRPQIPHATRCRRAPAPRRTWIAATSLVLGVIIASRPAHAQPGDADRLFSVGVELMSQGELSRACKAFEESNRIDPRAGTLIRLGDCREKNHQLASAWSAYGDALTRAKDPRKRDVAAARVAALEPRLSYLRVSILEHDGVEGLSITRDGQPLDRSSWNQPVFVDGGEHLIIATAPGHESWQISVYVADESARINIPLPRLEEKTGPVPQGAPDPAQLASQFINRGTSTPEPYPDRGTLTGGRKLPILLLGASAVSAATGLVLRGKASDKRGEAFQQCPDPQTPCARASSANDLIESSHHLTREANLAFGVSAITTITASILWLVSHRDMDDHHDLDVAMYSSSTGSNATLTGRF